VLIEEKMIEGVNEKEKLIQLLLIHPKIKAVRSYGLWLSVEFESLEINKKIIDNCIKKGVLTDWFLFATNCLRISPPLILSEQQIKKACEIILQACNDI